jgi:hypothetical protein
MTTTRESLDRVMRLVLVDRLAVTPWPLDRGWLRNGTRCCIWLLIAGLWCLGFGTATIAAVKILLGIPSAPLALDDSAASLHSQTVHLAQDASFAIVAGLLLLALAALPRHTAPQLQRPRVNRWVAGSLSIPFAAVASEIGFDAVMLLNAVLRLPQQGYPALTVDGTSAQLLWLANLALAGPVEEFALLGIVVVGLRRVGHSWTVVCIAAVAVRLPFHLYYGWGAAGLTAWVLLVVLVYRATGTLWGIVLEHSLWDVISALGPQAVEIRTVLLTVAACIISAAFLMRGPVRGGESARATPG